MKEYICKIHGKTEYYQRECFNKKRNKIYICRQCKQCVKKKASLWQKNNPEKKQEITQKHRLKNKNYYSRWHREWKAKNKGKVLSYERTHRAKKSKSLLNDLTHEQWLNVLDKYGYKCYYCGRENVKITQDHIIPLSRGGSHTKNNIVPSCQSCNSRKGTKLLEELSWKNRQQMTLQS